MWVLSFDGAHTTMERNIVADAGDFTLTREAPAIDAGALLAMTSSKGPRQTWAPASSPESDAWVAGWRPCRPRATIDPHPLTRLSTCQHQGVPLKAHDDRVRSVQQQVLDAAAQGIPVGRQKASVAHTVPDPYAKKRPRIDVRDLNHVLEIDPQARTCTAEPGVRFVDLVARTLEHGLIPFTVPELEGITLGGAVSGCSIESMSYKHGGFHDKCFEYEVVTGTGERVILTPDDDEFHLVHGSYGTLGIITRLTFELCEAKPYVLLENRLFDTFQAFRAELEARCAAGDYDFIDGG